MTDPLITIGISLLMIVFGIDQLLRPRIWNHYLSSIITRFVPFGDEVLMRAHAAGNILIGAFLLIPSFPEASIIVALGWWLTILPFAYKENWRIGARDTAIALALLSLLI